MLNSALKMNNYTFPILRHLADGKFHSGEALAKNFNVSQSNDLERNTACAKFRD
jgi:hypothetical protein